MDPTANVKRQLEISALLVEDLGDVERLAGELAELIHDLHMWLRGGGALPDQWHPESRRAYLPSGERRPAGGR